VQNQLREGGDRVVLNLGDDVTEVVLFGSALNAMIGASTELVIETANGTNVTLPTALLQEMMVRAAPLSTTGTFAISLTDLDVALNDNNLALASLALDVTVNGAQIARFDEPVRIERYIREDIRNNPYLNTNYNRIIARDAYGRIVGGMYDPITGIFAFDTYYTGEFVIEYVYDLNRLNLSLGSHIITNVAQPGLHAMDVLPLMESGRTLIPVRFIAEALGFDVDWNPLTQEVAIEFDGQTLVFAVGDMLEGMDVAARITDGRTMVPLRFVSEFFGAVVEWDAATRSIEIIR
jgi:hypothetical protein